MYQQVILPLKLFLNCDINGLVSYIISHPSGSAPKRLVCASEFVLLLDVVIYFVSKHSFF